MFGCNQVATIWNKWRNPETGKDEFFRHVIQCRFKNKVQSSVTGSNANIASSFMVITPYTEEYLTAGAWDKLDKEGRESHYTARMGDTVALGEHHVEITGIKPHTESDIKTMLLPDAFTVKAVQDNTRVAHGKHIKLEGV